MKLIIGLGNPGKEYENTRHNVGFMFLDALQKATLAPSFKIQKKFNAEMTEAIFSEEKIVLAKPMCFMNLSGEVVSKLVQFYHVPLTNLVVAYDDVDLPLGKGRYRSDGSAGTHNGMRSIIALLGSSNFPRIRFGIESRGETAPSQQDISSFVLSPFRPEEKEKLQASFQKGLDLILSGQTPPSAMSW